jgi:hypothetical protein
MFIIISEAGEPLGVRRLIFNDHFSGHFVTPNGRTQWFIYGTP